MVVAGRDIGGGRERLDALRVVRAVAERRALDRGLPPPLHRPRGEQAAERPRALDALL